MSGTIRVHAVHAVREEHLDEFKAVVATLIEKVRTGEPAYLSYELFLSDDERTCHIVGLLRDSDAVLAHLANAGDSIGRLAEIAPSTRIEIFCDVSDRLAAAGGAVGGGDRRALERLHALRRLGCQVPSDPVSAIATTAVLRSCCKSSAGCSNILTAPRSTALASKPSFEAGQRM